MANTVPSKKEKLITNILFCSVRKKCQAAPIGPLDTYYYIIISAHITKTHMPQLTYSSFVSTHRFLYLPSSISTGFLDKSQKNRFSLFFTVHYLGYSLHYIFTTHIDSFYSHCNKDFPAYVIIFYMSSYYHMQSLRI